MLIAMKGPPGAGKSTVARALSGGLGWPVIDKDDVKDVLDGQTTLAGAPAYEVMQRIVGRQVSQGLTVICDSPLPERAYDGLRRIAEAEGIPRLVVDTARPLPELVGEVVTWLAQHNSTPALEGQQCSLP